MPNYKLSYSAIPLSSSDHNRLSRSVLSCSSTKRLLVLDRQHPEKTISDNTFQHMHRTPLTSTSGNLFNLVPFLCASIFCSENFKPHSVNINPGLTELNLILGAQIFAKHFVKCILAALVTAYGNELPLGLTPAILAVVTKAPSVASKCSRAA
jgi:hypothetical protein